MAVVQPNNATGRAAGAALTASALVLVLSLLTLTACQSPQKGTTRPTTQDSGDLASRGPGEIPALANAVPADPKPLPRRLIQMDVFMLSLPFGAVSQNEEFWKRVNEGGLDPRTADMLQWNGVRVGEAAVEDWPFFKDIIDSHPASTQLNSYVAVEAKALEIPVRKDIPFQNVFLFDRAGYSRGRTHEQCDNLWTLAFLPTPRKEDYVHVILCPMVREQRRRLEIRTVRPRPEDPPEREVAYVSPEQLLDVNLRTDIPPGKFLVVGPSAQATPGSIGDAFLGGEGAGQRVERVMLLVPKFIAVQATRTEVRRVPGQPAKK